MLLNQNILPPPWMALPEIERGSMHWRMGVGEWYINQWGAWYSRLDESEKAEYLRLFPEPLPWLGCMTDAPACDSIHRGDLFVTLWREGGKPKYTRQTVADMHKAGEMPQLYMFWGHHPAKDGKIGRSCFSQWWKSDFYFGGQRYCCMEQCMMAGKAKLFEDAAVLEQIMRSDDPKAIKALGRKVQGFDEAAWNEVKYPLVLNGNYNKFVQNERLRAFLLSTGDSILVEASPYDCIWGIGLAADDPRAQDPQQWRGENLLGFALMEVRDEIRRAYQNAYMCCDPWDRGEK